ncbi:MAG: hypothetical protein KKH51_15715, partial [Actinobacteria bacterium]|nr:hypothetical protein [Actinomycetota bacterium]
MTDRRISRWAIAAIAATLALAAASTWVVKVFGPRAVNPDYFCNCSVAPKTRVLTSDLKWEEVGQLKLGQPLIAFEEHLGEWLPDGHLKRRRLKPAIITSLSFKK